MDKLFTPWKSGNLSYSSRLVRSATELFDAVDNGHVNPKELDVYRKLSSEPLGMIITAHTCVSPEGHSNPYQNAIWSDDYLDDARDIYNAASSGGIPVIMQIGHGGMKGEGSNGGLPVYTPDNMTETQIKDTVRAFGRAALRAKATGYNGVMIHTAHHYLLSQFMYDDFNHRTDSYGGSALNRIRISLECIEEIKKVCGDDYPVFMKINATDREHNFSYTKDIAECVTAASECGLEAVEISGWDSAPRGIPKEPYFLRETGLIAECGVPVIEVGGFRSAEPMNKALDAGVSAVSICRPLIAEPDFPSKLKNDPNYRSRCIGCCSCFSGGAECIL